MTKNPHPSNPLLIACLCAQWCDTCRSYRAIFEHVLNRHASSELSYVWIDIEDHHEVLASIDIENFPTLLVARANEALFYGTVTPHAQTLARLVKGAKDGSLEVLHHDAQLQGLLTRIRIFQTNG